MNAKTKTLQSGKPSKTVRNVLVQPFKTKWPLVTGNEREKVENLLNKISQEHLAIGSNAACGILHNGQACALFLTSDFYPQILGKQIIRMARRNSSSVKILAIENLSWNGIQEKLIAVRKSASKDPTICNLLELTEHICMLSGFDDDSSDVLKTSKAKSSTKLKFAQNEGGETIDKFYLERVDSKQREFVPNISTLLSKTTKISTNPEWGEHISFKPKPMEIELDHQLKQKPVFPKIKKSSVTYAPLIVNRVRGNPNRKKQIKSSYYFDFF
ncbi:uncharacterized protein LOC129773890 [Toxorhynchites rutilus septentrionalis]|uniref:uncharacterized protein LOC129773890 n=1 Tax=Toxorhynchites rutilus septentrionalis TaxID=329112 RepID=UPI0024792A04|nr:uncharacterized protein LOC129773890 [Toxorhynchites rutilus septentrionalis]